MSHNHSPDALYTLPCDYTQGGKVIHADIPVPYVVYAAYHNLAVDTPQDEELVTFVQHEPFFSFRQLHPVMPKFGEMRLQVRCDNGFESVAYNKNGALLSLETQQYKLKYSDNGRGMVGISVVAPLQDVLPESASDEPHELFFVKNQRGEAMLKNGYGKTSGLNLNTAQTNELKDNVQHVVAARGVVNKYQENLAVLVKAVQRAFELGASAPQCEPLR